MDEQVVGGDLRFILVTNNRLREQRKFTDCCSSHQSAWHYDSLHYNKKPPAGGDNYY